MRTSAEDRIDQNAWSLFSAEVEERIRESARKGKFGWADPEICSNKELRDRLLDNLQAEDYLDVAAYAMFLHLRESNEIGRLGGF